MWYVIHSCCASSRPTNATRIPWGTAPPPEGPGQRSPLLQRIVSFFRTLLSLLPQKSRPATWAVSPTISFLESSRLVASLIFLVTVFAIVLISYQGVSTAELPILPGQSATVSVHAGVPFSYSSQEQTRMLGEKLKDRKSVV